MTARDELRVLVWAPRGRDAALAAQLLQRSALSAEAVDSIDRIAEQVTTAGCAILTEEALLPQARAKLVDALATQPPWCDFPVIMFARATGSVADAMVAARVLGNVTVLERPLQSRTLISAVVAALRSRRRQYDARAAIERRDEFLAMLGHELRNPLAAMVLAVEALHRDCGEISPRPRAILDRQTRHLARLVDDLLDVARVTTGKVTLKRSPINLHEVLARCLQGAEVLAEPRGTTLHLRVPPEPAIVDGDPVRLEEIFGNLLSNAIKYSPEQAHVEITSHVDPVRATCVVEVTDEGIGIAPAMLPRVFDLFMQAEGSLARSQGGLGIGLTLVKSLVELHGGTVEALSEGVGRGCRFRVVLPTIAHGVERGPREHDSRNVPPGVRVVVVEDNPDLLELTRLLLESFSCEVMTAADGPSGLAAIERFAPDLALVDIGLPGLDGYELARRLRGSGRRVPYLVAMTGYGQLADRQRALGAGFDQHLTKPVTAGTLLQVLTRSCDLSPRVAAL